MFLTSVRNVGDFCTVKFAVRFYFWPCQRPQCWVEDQHKRDNDILTSQLGLKVAPVTPSHFTCAKIGHHCMAFHFLNELVRMLNLREERC